MVTAESMRDARSADNVVIEVMAAARSIGADTSTVLLSGNVCFNDPLRLAFQNHLGHRLQVADHPMHALVLGAAHLLATDNENGEPESAGRHAEPTPPRPAPAPPRQAEQVPSRPDLSASRPVEPAPRSVESGPHQVEAAQQQAISPQRQAEAQRQVDSPQRRAEPAHGRPDQSQPQWPVQYGSDRRTSARADAGRRTDHPGRSRRGFPRTPSRSR
jgi:hypothetical protein